LCRSLFGNFANLLKPKIRFTSKKETLLSLWSSTKRQSTAARYVPCDTLREALVSFARSETGLGCSRLSDRFQWRVPYSFARRARGRIEISRLVLQPGFSYPGLVASRTTSLTTDSISKVTRCAGACCGERTPDRGNRPEEQEARSSSVRHWAEKSRASRCTCCYHSLRVPSSEASGHSPPGGAQRSTYGGYAGTLDHIRVRSLRKAHRACVKNTINMPSDVCIPVSVWACYALTRTGNSEIGTLPLPPTSVNC